MMFKRYIATAALLLFIGSPLLAQKNETTVGFQYKPIIPRDYLSSGIQTEVVDNITFSLAPRMGFTGGMVIRHGITDRLSFESGINYVKRNLTLSVDEGATQHDFDFRIIGYEIPVNGLVYVQLGRQFYMNTSLGLSFDYFPSHVATGIHNIEMLGIRENRMQFSLNGNLGYEYRVPTVGYFYLGVSYHRPFKEIYTTYTEHTNDTGYTRSKFSIAGNYITADIRYFFPQPTGKN